MTVMTMTDGWEPTTTCAPGGRRCILFALLALLPPALACSDATAPEDQVYATITGQVLALQDKWDTELGIMPAIIGERRILLGRSALPELMSPDLQ